LVIVLSFFFRFIYYKKKKLFKIKGFGTKRILLIKIKNKKVRGVFDALFGPIVKITVFISSHLACSSFLNEKAQ